MEDNDFTSYCTYYWYSVLNRAILFGFGLSSSTFGLAERNFAPLGYSLPLADVQFYPKVLWYTSVYANLKRLSYAKALRY